jgi:hypothetical protein
VAVADARGVPARAPEVRRRAVRRGVPDPGGGRGLQQQRHHRVHRVCRDDESQRRAGGRVFCFVCVLVSHPLLRQCGDAEEFAHSAWGAVWVRPWVQMSFLPNDAPYASVFDGRGEPGKARFVGNAKRGRNLNSNIVRQQPCPSSPARGVCTHRCHHGGGVCSQMVQAHSNEQTRTVHTKPKAPAHYGLQLVTTSLTSICDCRPGCLGRTDSRNPTCFCVCFSVYAVAEGRYLAAAGREGGAQAQGRVQGEEHRPLSGPLSAHSRNRAPFFFTAKGPSLHWCHRERPAPVMAPLPTAPSKPDIVGVLLRSMGRSLLGLTIGAGLSGPGEGGGGANVSASHAWLAGCANAGVPPVRSQPRRGAG